MRTFVIAYMEAENEITLRVVHKEYKWKAYEEAYILSTDEEPDVSNTNESEDNDLCTAIAEEHMSMTGMPISVLEVESVFLDSDNILITEVAS